MSVVVPWTMSNRKSVVVDHARIQIWGIRELHLNVGTVLASLYDQTRVSICTICILLSHEQQSRVVVHVVVYLLRVWMIRPTHRTRLSVSLVDIVRTHPDFRRRPRTERLHLRVGRGRGSSVRRGNVSVVHSRRSGPRGPSPDSRTDETDGTGPRVGLTVRASSPPAPMATTLLRVRNATGVVAEADAVVEVGPKTYGLAFTGSVPRPPISYDSRNTRTVTRLPRIPPPTPDLLGPRDLRAGGVWELRRGPDSSWVEGRGR